MIICGKPFLFWKRLFHKLHTTRYFGSQVSIHRYYVQDLKPDIPDYYQQVLDRMRAEMNKAGINGK